MQLVYDWPHCYASGGTGLDSREGADQPLATMREQAPQPEGMQWIWVAWGLLGVIALLMQALWRITPIAWEPWEQGIVRPWQGVVCVIWSLFNVYTEGHRAFYLKFSPRVVARAFYVGAEGRWYERALAPLFCMSFFSATRRGVIVAWAMVVGIVGLVILVHQLDQPWRGIIDAGVVAGLAWGLGSILVWAFRYLKSGAPLPPDLPVARS